MKNLQFKGCSVMKYTRESSTSQIGPIQKQNLVNCLAAMGVTHIEITMIAHSDTYLRSKGFTPSPRTIEAETQQWYDIIHNTPNVYGPSVYGGYLKVYDRCLWPGMEGSSGGWGGSLGAYEIGFPIGTAASAATDGSSTVCGRYYQYLTNNVGTSRFANGDILCPIPECTGPAFSGSFWTSQSGLATCVAELEKVADNLYASVGKTCFAMSNPNFSEVASGWCWNGPNSFASTGFTCYDYYGALRGSWNATPADYTFDVGEIYAGRSPVTGGGNGAGGRPQVFGEWGDLSGSILLNGKFTRSGDNYATGTACIEDWHRFLIEYYKAITVLVNSGKIAGFNYWGGWNDQNTSIVYKVGTGESSQYFLNSRGRILREFFINGGLATNRQQLVTAGTFEDGLGGRNMYF